MKLQNEYNDLILHVELNRSKEQNNSILVFFRITMFSMHIERAFHP